MIFCIVLRSTQCRAKHSRCDETKPVCGRCARLKLQCNFDDFIVNSVWSNLGAASASRTSSVPAIEHYPASTWEIFAQPTADMSKDALADAFELPESTGMMTAEVIQLLRKYQSGIGTWMDIFDHHRFYEIEVVRRATSSALLLHSLCALTARQTEIVTRSDCAYGAASTYYVKSLRLLIAALADPQACKEDILTATILLSSYEVLSAPGTEHRKHLYGAMALCRSHGSNAAIHPLGRASFWIFARQDVSLALINECPTALDPKSWGMPRDQVPESEDLMGNRTIWIMVLVIAIVFGAAEDKSEILTGYEQLTSLLNDWHQSLPSSSKAHICGSRTEDGFQDIWFATPAAGIAQ